MFMVRAIDELLNKVTMYRLALSVLAGFVGLGVLFGLLGIVSVSPWGLIISSAVVAVVAYGSNLMLARLYGVPVNAESWRITALILVCILPPAATWQWAAGIALAGVIAVASKYVLALHRQHVFNPAAIGALLVGLLGITHATWWVGNPAMLPFTLLGGLLIVRKLRRFRMVSVFVIMSLLVMGLIGLSRGDELSAVFTTVITSWPLVFLGTIMLIEPITAPSGNRAQLLYAALVGAFFTSQLHFGPLSSTPQMALVLGNLVSFATWPTQKVRLRLKAAHRISERVYDYEFVPDRPLNYVAGQYMEWTLASRRTDSRGNRHTFTIASAPTEPTVHVGVRFYEPSSTFKRTLRALKPGDTIMGGPVAGTFTLPKNMQEKLLFIAGGIGITPFRSMLRSLIDHKQHRNIVVLYVVSDPADVAYREVLEAATVYGVKIMYLLNNAVVPRSWQGMSGPLDAALLAQNVPDLLERRCYIAGPPAMVRTYQKLLRDEGVTRHAIMTDHFAGY